MAPDEAPAASAMPPPGVYRYELRRGSDLVALEEETLAAGVLCGVRRTPDGLNRHEVEARLDADGLTKAVTVRYRRGPFSRSASYETAEDMIRGQLSAVGGREAVSAKLGRMREVDADLVLCKTLIIARVRARGESRWIGRVATVDPNTLVIGLYKQTYRRLDETGRRWVFEPRMGDADEIEIDEAGRIVRIRGRDGIETILVGFTTERAG
jgi:hypothetical protein